MKFKPTWKFKINTKVRIKDTEESLILLELVGISRSNAKKYLCGKETKTISKVRKWSDRNMKEHLIVKLDAILGMDPIFQYYVILESIEIVK